MAQVSLCEVAESGSTLKCGVSHLSRVSQQAGSEDSWWGGGEMWVVRQRTSSGTEWARVLQGQAVGQSV